MARIQALKQQRFIETSEAPISSTQVTGGTSHLGGAGGVPKFHPLKSSNPVLKSSNLFHSMRIKKFGSSLRAPKVGLPRLKF